MSAGNTNNRGGKKNNHSYQFRSLKLLGAIAEALAADGGGGLATEATLLDVLSSIDMMRDFEIRLVVDDNGDTWMEVRYWNSTTGALGTPVYYAAGSVIPGSPVAPLTYINPTSYLAQIVTNSSGIAAVIEIDNDAITSDSFVKTGGRAVNTGAYAPGYDADDAANQAYDKDNGGLLVNQANLAIDEDEVLAHLGATSSNEGVVDSYRNTGLGKTPVSVKAGPGNLYGWNIINPNDFPVYVKFYNIAVGSVVVGTSDIEKTLFVPSSSHVFQEPNVRQLYFDTEISVACLKGLSDGDTSDPDSPVHFEAKYK